MPTLIGQLAGPGNFAKWEFIRLIGGARGPAVPLPLSLYPSWLITNFFFATEGRAEAEARAGGPFVQNVTHHYTLTAAERAYLAMLGLNAAPVLAAMNASERFSGEPSARNYMTHYATFSGKLRDPVRDLLVQASVNGLGHCNLSPSEIGAAIELGKDRRQADRVNAGGVRAGSVHGASRVAAALASVRSSHGLRRGARRSHPGAPRR